MPTMGKPVIALHVPPPLEEELPQAAELEVEAPKGTKVIRRADGREVRKQTLYLPKELSRRLSAYCAKAQRSMSEVVEGALLTLLDGEERQSSWFVRKANELLTPHPRLFKLTSPLLSVTERVLSGLFLGPA